MILKLNLHFYISFKTKKVQWIFPVYKRVHPSTCIQAMYIVYANISPVSEGGTKEAERV